MANKPYSIKIGKSTLSLSVPVVPVANLGLPSKIGRISATNARKKHVVILNSHSLSDYQRCPKRYEFNNLIQIEPAGRREVFAVGAYWGKMLEIFYRAKSNNATTAVLAKLIRRMSKCAANNETFDEASQNLLSTRIIEYWKRYQSEQVEVLGVEVGFSIILYEDAKHLFIYEGRPDRVIRMPNPFNPRETVICIIDDKTRAKNIDLVDFNNQVNGYLEAAKTNWFMYNYMGKQQDLKKSFERQLVYRTFEEVAKWKQTTIKWYFRLLHDRLNGEFLESMQCPGQYSNCEFLPLCSAKDKLEYDAVMNSKFKKRDGERKSW
jgi:hypothetical protein